MPFQAKLFIEYAEQRDLRSIELSRSWSISWRCDDEHTFGAMRWRLVYDFDESPSVLLYLLQVLPTLTDHPPNNLIVTEKSEDGLWATASPICWSFVRPILVVSVTFRSVAVAWIVISAIERCPRRIISHLVH